MRWLVTGFLLPLIGGVGVFGVLRQPNDARPIPPDPSISQSMQTSPLAMTPETPEPNTAPIVGDAVDFVVRRNLNKSFGNCASAWMTWQPFAIFPVFAKI
jgi:hypothetical protein